MHSSSSMALSTRNILYPLSVSVVGSFSYSCISIFIISFLSFFHSLHTQRDPRVILMHRSLLWRTELLLWSMREMATAGVQTETETGTEKAATETGQVDEDR